MSYKSKRIIAVIITFFILALFYNFYVLGSTKYIENLQYWSIVTLVFIFFTIIIQIIIQIFFHIAMSIGIAINEKNVDEKNIERIINSSSHEDEMDKLIKFKSANIRSTFAIISIIVMLILFSFRFNALFVFKVFFWLITIGVLIEGVASIYYYAGCVKTLHKNRLKQSRK